MQLPEGYLPIIPYLVVKDSAKFINFMESIFHAKLRYSALREEGVIMHGELQIEQAVVMFCDATANYQPKPAGMFLYVENADEIFNRAMAAGMPQLAELADRPYGRGGGFGDEWGNQWWVNTPPVIK
jgi:PhnB protein